MNPIQLVPTLPNLFFTKNDPQDPRLGEIIKPALISSNQLQENDYVILGYPDDEGIKMNGGRSGAAEAPKMIRQFLYKMTVPTLSRPKRNFFDLGDLEIKSELATRHDQAKSIMTGLHQKKIKTLTLGGGHDYGYSDAAAFILSQLSISTEKPIVINFDAHLDVRPTHQGFNSGTPFYRLLTEFKDKIDFIEIGLQPQCNSMHHRKWALDHNAQLFDMKDIRSRSLSSLFENSVFKRINKNTPLYISFDIDCLTSSDAGGCSQSWVTGLNTADCLEFMNLIYLKSDCRGLGIYEVSPPLDVDFRTSKTAALLAYYFMFSNEISGV